MPAGQSLEGGHGGNGGGADPDERPDLDLTPIPHDQRQEHRIRGSQGRRVGKGTGVIRQKRQ